ncbi:hypothetical protein CO666_09405 [Rhizobium chutanense]|uniref:Uncharacterized protein n=1 Tax=Rhizobium chutanense TaxID=2035448 RepID=A0A2A6JG49_9HYPH|nr:hypothetical protein [Rhizobium chutanense]PDT04925.1 hypothetical protein CO666_09405 [Rhizobium chutanense]
MIISIEAMHLLPHPFDMQAPHPPPRVVCGNGSTPPPSCRSVFFESLPHLLPRQAFSFWPTEISIDPRKTAAIHHTEATIFLLVIDFIADFSVRLLTRTRRQKHIDFELVVQLCNHMVHCLVQWTAEPSRLRDGNNA